MPARADHERAAQGRVGDDRAGFDNDPAIDRRRVIDLAVDSGLDLFEEQAVGFKQRRELAGVDPPALEDLVHHRVALVDQPLDRVGDLELAAR